MPANKLSFRDNYQKLPKNAKTEDDAEEDVAYKMLTRRREFCFFCQFPIFPPLTSISLNELFVVLDILKKHLKKDILDKIYYYQKKRIYLR